MDYSDRPLYMEGLLALLRYQVMILSRRGKPRNLRGVGNGPPSIPIVPPTLSQRVVLELSFCRPCGNKWLAWPRTTLTPDL